MRSVVARAVGSVAMAAALLSASCSEPRRANGEPCLIDDQCENEYCRAGLCATRPTTDGVSKLPPPADAAPDAVDDASADAPGESGAEAGSDANPEAASDATTDVTTDVVDDAPDDAVADAPGDSDETG